MTDLNALYDKPTRIAELLVSQYNMDRDLSDRAVEIAREVMVNEFVWHDNEALAKIIYYNPKFW